MAVIKVAGTAPAAERTAPLLSLGFRPFFFGAGVFAVVTMALWSAVWGHAGRLSVAPLSPSQWHAHEMIFGYAMAVVAGFVLTAVENWTGRPTLRGAPLALLALVWSAARLAFLFGGRYLVVGTALDLSFNVCLAVSILRPIIQTRQWRQMAIAAKVTLMSVGQILFLLGALGRLDRGVYWGLYGGLYLLIGLILTMGARIMPAFLQNGVDGDVVIRSPRWIGLASLALYLVFLFSEMIRPGGPFTAVAAGLLFVVLSIRLVTWHTPGLWKKPLLWSLFLSFVFIDVGFLLFALRPWLGWPVYLPLHAMAVGGLGLVTLSMMTRVSLGHSGRSVHRPPASTTWSAVFLVTAALVRVFAAGALPRWYTGWIGAAQGLWILAFGLFVLTFAPIYVRPNEDAPIDSHR